MRDMERSSFSIIYAGFKIRCTDMDYSIIKAMATMQEFVYKIKTFQGGTYG